MSRPGKIVKQIIAKYGPRTNQELFSFIPLYPQLTSGNYIKTKVMPGLLRDRVIRKKSVVVDEAEGKPVKKVWRWDFVDQKLADDIRAKGLEPPPPPEAVESSGTGEPPRKSSMRGAGGVGNRGNANRKARDAR